jgi:hypothetical protein
MRSSEECDPPVRCLWKMKMESHRHSYHCSCKDLRVYPRECNKVNKSFLYVLSNVLWYYTHLSIICVNYDPGTHMRCIWFCSEKRVWHESKGKEPWGIHAYIPHQIPKRKVSKPPQENRQGLRKSPKGENGRDTIKPSGIMSNHLCIPWRFIQGLACLLIIHPSLKISPWSSQASPRNSKGKEEDVGVLDRQPTKGSTRSRWMWPCRDR